jgi:uncharacterized protein YkwD
VSSPRNILTALALAATWTLVAITPASATSCPNSEVEAPTLSQSQTESSIACLINEERTSRGLAPVHPNGDLRQAGLRHSNDMIGGGFFAHTSPDGVTFVDRIEATGYTRNIRSWVVGENLVWGSGPLSTPGSLVTAWMNSPPHSENLLRGRFREIGIAAVRGTPEGTSNPAGITVSSEYGYRAGKAAKKKRGKAARKAKVRRRIRKGAR